MDVNGKVTPDETVPGVGDRGIKENGARGKFKYDIFYIT
jgi:hypothetical protein